MLRFKRPRNKLRKIKLQDSLLMSKERYGTRSVSMFSKQKRSESSFCVKLMTLPILFTQEVPRCTMILRADIGGMELGRKKYGFHYWVIQNAIWL
jgi:hypothetical protein